VQRLHHRHAAAFGGPHHSGAEQQERVVDMHGLDALAFYQVFHLAGSATVPDGVQRQQRLGRTVGGFLVAALIHQHGMAVAFQQFPLRRKNGILAAGQPVMAVYQQNFHAVASFSA